VEATDISKTTADVDPFAPSVSTAPSPWEAIGAWAQTLADRVAGDQPAQHVTVFVHDVAVNALRLVGQVWGAGEDTGAVVAGIFTVPLDGTVCGRVFRSGAAALCADVSLDPDFRAFPGGRTRSSLTVPLIRDEAVVGVVNVEAPWISAFSITDYERLTKLAASAVTTMPSATIADSAPVAEVGPPAA
jgi:GAF domain-containing protein